jgi:hypothetical protein
MNWDKIDERIAILVTCNEFYCATYNSNTLQNVGDATEPTSAVDGRNPVLIQAS